METFFDIVGSVVLVFLILIGLVSGWIAGTITGRNRLVYMLLGVIGAIALPFVLAALGVGIVAAGGVLVILILSLLGAVLLIALARALLK